MIAAVELRPVYPIKTPRLRLRPLTTDDVESLLIYRGRADVCRYLPFEPMTRDVVLTRLAEDFARTAITAPGQRLTLGVELAGVELAGVELAGVESAGVELAAVDLAGVDLAGVDLPDGAFAGRLIGDIVLFFHNEEHRAGEIGYVFAPEFQGHGYATEAAAALIGLGFDQLGLHRIEARLDARNSDSARLAARLGMRPEAHFVSNEMFKGEWSDEIVYAVLAQEWPAAFSPPSRPPAPGSDPG